MGRKEPKEIIIEINHQEVIVPEGISVHRAAELNNIYIPSLCSHKDLSPFGGCRLCMVEIEGMKGYPLSCNTIVKEGMKVLTDTVMLRELRKEILKLILSEHPSSCLVCDDKNECSQYQTTIRKAGVTTGCRFCPNDGQCELQTLVEKIGITEIDYPIYYQNYNPEHDDPFYDRDYNICILCGRCVRMCQEVRGTSVLTFTYRGPYAKIGTAFGRTHLKAGCEFCGACVDVCPTGALADKVSKWDGKPDGYIISTCPFCSIGCQVELAFKEGRFSKAKANLDPEINDGQLCVRGRFCMPEVTHHFERAKKPMLQKGNYFREVSWEEVLEKIASVLKDVKPEEFIMLVSPDLTNESLFTAQKFVRNCLKCNSIDSTGRLELSGGLGLWSKLFSSSISIKDIKKADAIIVVGLDSRFDFSILGVKTRQALNLGAKLITIDPVESNLARYSDNWIQPIPGQEGLILKFFSSFIKGDKVDLKSFAEKTSININLLEKSLEILSSAKDIAVILAPHIFHYTNNEALIESLLTLSTLENINLIPLYFGSNIRGLIEMGALYEIAPGGATIANKEGLNLYDILYHKKQPKVIYLVGDIPFNERPECDFLIVQDIYLPTFKVDAFLPSTTFVESGGTIINIEGRVQELKQVENIEEGSVTGYMRPDWQIFSNLAQYLKCDSINYTTTKEIVNEIHEVVPNFPLIADRNRRKLNFNQQLPIEKLNISDLGEGDFLLITKPCGYRYRGIDISSKVEGLKELALEEGFQMNKEDIKLLGITDKIKITFFIEKEPIDIIGSVKSDIECQRGTIYYTKPITYNKIPQNPIKVRIKAL